MAGSWSAEIGAIPVHFGRGVLERLGALAREQGASRALLVTDAGVRGAGHLDAALASLARAGVAAAVFDEVAENPTTDDVERGRARAAAEEIDLLIGLGGGSSLDCAKGINFLLSNGGRMEDYQGFGKATRPLLPSLGVPTTAGTGSEAQSFALIATAATHRKMACGDRGARFRAVLLDPLLPATAPRGVAAATGLDAISHAVESYVATRATPYSRLLAREAWRLLSRHLERALAAPEDGEAQGSMLLGAHLAGAAVEGSMLGAAHACANPLTAEHGVVHGAAVALMLPHVVRLNAEAAGEGYDGLLEGGGGAELARRVAELRDAAGLPARLRDCGVEADRLPALAAEAAGQWTASFNPRPVGAADLLALYEAAW